jgi:hypothetical protein
MLPSNLAKNESIIFQLSKLNRTGQNNCVQKKYDSLKNQTKLERLHKIFYIRSRM